MDKSPPAAEAPRQGGLLGAKGVTRLGRGPFCTVGTIRGGPLVPGGFFRAVFRPQPGTQSSTAWAMAPPSAHRPRSPAQLWYSVGLLTKPVSSSTAGHRLERVT